MKHIRFEENMLIDESYAGGGDGDSKKSKGIAQHFADSLEKRGHETKWYHQLPPEPGVSGSVSEETLASLTAEAAAALHTRTNEYNNKMSSRAGGELAWARTLVKRGAIADRVAAATLLIQESPVHSESVLRMLINNVKPAKKKDALVAVDALSELFVSELLPPGVKLQPLSRQPLHGLQQLSSGDSRTRTDILALWHFQHILKQLYAEYVSNLNTLAHDSVEANRAKAVSAIAYLLTHHPENEQVLLQHLINKLGDPSQAVASKVIYHLCQLVYNHPNMKSVLLTHMERVLFRSNISSRAQYYGLCFLNQLHLERDDETVAENLIRIYFAFFNANIKKGEIDSRLMGALLTGVKRAFPFARRDAVAGDTRRHVDTVHRLVHVAGFNTSVHALALLHTLSEPGTQLADRYYSALYRKLGSPQLLSSSAAALLLHLVYKSLRRDTDLARVAACLKRCLQLSAHAAPAHAAALLLLVSQVTKDKKKREALRLDLPKYEVKEEEEGERKEEETKEECKEDTTQEGRSTEEEVKEEKKPALDLLHGDKRDLLEEESEEEYYDVKEEESGAEGAVRRRGGGARGWHHAGLQPPTDTAQTRIQLQRAANAHKQSTRYEPCARDPRHAGAALAAATELASLSRHAHPSVALFANKLLAGEVIHYAGDPLKDFSCVRFLERFAFKNPKRRAPETARPDQLHTIRGSHPKFAVRKNYTPKGLRGVRVTSAVYLNESPANIPPDEMFLYRYLRERREAVERAEQRTEGDEESDVESVASDEFNSFLDQLGGARQHESEEELDWSGAVQEGDTHTRARSSHTQQHEWSEDEAEDETEDEAEADSDDDYDSADSDQPPRAARDTGSASLFASAEEFAEVLEEAGRERGAGTSRAVDTRDSAAPRQLLWEETRTHARKRQHTRAHTQHKRNRR